MKLAPTLCSRTIPSALGTDKCLTWTACVHSAERGAPGTQELRFEQTQPTHACAPPATQPDCSPLSITVTHTPGALPRCYSVNALKYHTPPWGQLPLRRGGPGCHAADDPGVPWPQTAAQTVPGAPLGLTHTPSGAEAADPGPTYIPCWPTLVSLGLEIEHPLGLYTKTDLPRQVCLWATHPFMPSFLIVLGRGKGTRPEAPHQEKGVSSPPNELRKRECHSRALICSQKFQVKNNGKCIIQNARHRTLSDVQTGLMFESHLRDRLFPPRPLGGT